MRVGTGLMGPECEMDIILQYIDNVTVASGSCEGGLCGSSANISTSGVGSSSSKEESGIVMSKIFSNDFSSSSCGKSGATARMRI